MLVEEFQTFGWITNPSPLLEKGHPSGRLGIYFSLEMSFMEFSLGGREWSGRREFSSKTDIVWHSTLPKPTHQDLRPHINNLVGFYCIVSLDAFMIGMATRDSEMSSLTSVWAYLFHLLCVP